MEDIILIAGFIIMFIAFGIAPTSNEVREVFLTHGPHRLVFIKSFLSIVLALVSIAALALVFFGSPEYCTKMSLHPLIAIFMFIFPAVAIWGELGWLLRLLRER
ncbi:MAG TPA: hypothetical protein VF817_01265 [Patescibacteria group bacterium]